VTSPEEHEDRGSFEGHLDALRTRLVSLSDHVLAAGEPTPSVTELLGELSAALQALEASAAQSRARHEALVEAHQHLDVEMARYRELFDLAPDGYLLTDMNGLIVEANRAACALLGTPEPLLRSRALVAFVSVPDRRRVHDHLRMAITRSDEGSFALEARITPPDARPFPARLHLSASTPSSGEPGHIRCLIADISALAEARGALEAALSRAHQATEALREADRTKDVLLLAALHDLNTPVAAVAGLAEILFEHPDLPQGEIRRIAERISSTSAQLRSILTNLLDAERILGGHAAVQRQPTDLTAIVTTAARDLELTGASVALPTEPVVAVVDPVLTTRIVENLLSNAVRHTPSGTAISVGLHRREEGVVVVVDDSGPGIPDEAKEAIFEAFERQERREPAGLGLGLFIVRRFAELQGGRAWVEDAPSGGASFRVLLPESPPDEASRAH